MQNTKTEWEKFVIQKVLDTMKAQAEAGAVGQSVWKPVKIATVEPGAIFSAIRKHARRVKDGRSHFTSDQQMDAIIGLANFGSKKYANK
jgi:hypothetical protein